MQYLKGVFTSEFQKQYKNKAFEDSDAYLAIAENLNLEQKQINRNIDKVYELSKNFVSYQKDNVSPGSVQIVIKKFKTDFQVRNYQLMLLDLLLRMTQQSFGIKAVQIEQSCQIKQDSPLLKPDDFLNSRLQSEIYDFLEDENNLIKFIGKPVNQAGFLLLWLFLKEGIDDSTLLLNVIFHRENTTAISHNWFIEDKKRVWLSATAQLLLCAYWNSKPSKFRSCITEISSTLIEQRIISTSSKITISLLKSMLRIEYILKASSSNFAQKIGSIQTTPLSQESIYRIMVGKSVENTSSKYVDLKVTCRQNSNWRSAVRSSKTKLSRKRDLHKDLTTQEQVSLIRSFTDSIKVLSKQKSKTNYTEVKNQLRVWLQDKINAHTLPFCWLLLSWIYQLLSKGGKRNKLLRARTIKAYVNTIATPFIHEFSDCKADALDGQTWAEKLNSAAENITSSNRKYFLYFANYIVINDLVPDLCLADLDISSSSGNVSANIITHTEAEAVIDILNRLDGALSELAVLCFCFSFYSGLRRGEIAGLQYADFNLTGNEYISLHVRPNKFRELKSSQSSRNLPLEVLWPTHAKDRLSNYLLSSKLKFTKKKSKIFKDDYILIDALSVVTDALKLVTAEPKIRFHHCRHSFANWLYILFLLQEDVKRLEYNFICHPYFYSINREKIMGRLSITSFSRKKLWAVSSLLGHSSPAVTMSSYIHISEFIHRLKFANSVPSSRLIRRFWGQGIKVDSHGRLVNFPAAKRHLLTAFPSQLQQVEIAQYDINKKIDLWLKTIETIEENYSMSLSQIWHCFYKFAEGNSVENISSELYISQNQLAAILEIDPLTQKTEEDYSQNNQHILSLYNNMSKQQFKIMNFLVSKFDEQGSFEKLNEKVNLVKISTLVKHLVRKKDFLIRSYDNNAVLSLLKLVKLLDLSERHVHLRWYFPSPSQFKLDELNTYRNDLRFWMKNINEHLFPKLNIEVVIPHALKHHVNSASNLKVTVSDEGLFLNYLNRGTVSVHLLQTKFSSASKNIKNGHHSRRNKAYVCFIRLLVIFNRVNNTS